jgi:AmmeMemoRadiSam system protein B
MKYKIFNASLIILGLLALVACKYNAQGTNNVRLPVDTIGFAQYAWQMDSIMERVNRTKTEEIYKAGIAAKVIISPHDDYAYVGNLYQQTLKNVKAKTIFLFGVAHKARLLNLENQIVFDSFDYWKAPNGNVKVSDVRQELLDILPAEIYQVNDSMQQLEHSLEAIIPFLQYYNKKVEIIPILVPYMSFQRMKEISLSLSDAILTIAEKQNWTWGKDFAIVISTDAVHYGDEDWGGSNFAYYGTDSLGYQKAMAHEQKIMETISGKLNPEKIKKFTQFTVEENDHKKYKWTWCGRYSVPLGLLTSYYLNYRLDAGVLTGIPVGYSTSIDHLTLPVDDLGMGVTAPANHRHWVGYAAMVYR